MDLKKLIKTKEFIEEMSILIERIIRNKFSKVTGEEKEDIAQEVKLKIWRMVSSGKNINNLKSYLWKVVHTTTLDMIGKRMNKVSSDITVGEKCGNSAPEFLVNLPESLIEKKEMKSFLDKAVNSLSQNKRIVMKLHLTGMNIREIADFLQWSESKVNHLYYRGLDDLKKGLKNMKHGQVVKL